MYYSTNVRTYLPGAIFLRVPRFPSPRNFLACNHRNSAGILTWYLRTYVCAYLPAYIHRCILAY